MQEINVSEGFKLHRMNYTLIRTVRHEVSLQIYFQSNTNLPFFLRSFSCLSTSSTAAPRRDMIIPA